MDSVTVESVGDLGTLLASFQRSLRAANKSPKTCAVYSEAGNQLLAFLIEAGMPTAVSRDPPRARRGVRRAAGRDENAGNGLQQIQGTVLAVQLPGRLRGDHRVAYGEDEATEGARGAGARADRRPVERNCSPRARARRSTIVGTSRSSDCSSTAA